MFKIMAYPSDKPAQIVREYCDSYHLAQKWLEAFRANGWIIMGVTRVNR